MDTLRYALGLALLLGVSSSTAFAEAPDFLVTVDTPGGAGNYVWNISIAGGPFQANPTLYLRWGKTYTIEFSHTSTYPFYVWEYDVGAYPIGSDIDTGEAGLSSNPTQSTLTKTITFEPRSDQPDAFYYVSSAHTEMTGAIRVSIFKAGFD